MLWFERSRCGLRYEAGSGSSEGFTHEGRAGAFRCPVGLDGTSYAG